MTIREDLTTTGNSAKLTHDVLVHHRHFGTSETVAKMVSNSMGHLTISSHPALVSSKKSNKELIDPKGTSETTVVFSGILEDAACMPREE